MVCWQYSCLHKGGAAEIVFGSAWIFNNHVHVCDKYMHFAILILNQNGSPTMIQVICCHLLAPSPRDNNVYPEVIEPLVNERGKPRKEKREKKSLHTFRWNISLTWKEQPSEQVLAFLWTKEGNIITSTHYNKKTYWAKLLTQDLVLASNIVNLWKLFCWKEIF